MSDVQVIVCRVGRLPTFETLTADERGGHLTAMQAIVGGYVGCVTLDDGLDCWFNDGNDELPLNRCFPTTGRGIPAGFEDAIVIDCTDGGAPEQGAPAEWRICGDLFLARSVDGEIVSATAEDLARYLARFEADDIADAKRANDAAIPEGFCKNCGGEHCPHYTCATGLAGGFCDACCDED